MHCCKQVAGVLFALVLSLSFSAALLHTTGCGGGGGGGDDDSGVSVSSPQSGQTVAQRTVVSGQSSNISSDNEVWLIIYSHSVRRYYPQAPKLPNDSSWSRTVTFGGAGDSGKKFDVIVVIVGATGKATLDAYVAASQASGNWPGITVLPAGSVAIRFTVTRL